MLQDLILALPAALLVGVAPGWFWASCLQGGDADPAERLAFATALSMTLVPAAALALVELSGTGVTPAIAVAAPLAVFAAGLAVRLAAGVAESPGEHPPSRPATPGPVPLALFAGVLGLVLWTGFVPPEGGRYAFVVPVAAVGAALLLAGAGWLGTRPAAPMVLLALVLAPTLARGYAGPVLHDWPYLRGGDQYNHAVQAQEMLAAGHYDAFLVYPPGFSTLTACVSRLSGLEPLEIYPVLAPALIALPALACYALAKELWGWECGVAAAAFAGLLLGGPWANVAEARYPNLVSAQFLLVLVVAALVRLYRSPGPRAGLSLALLGSSVVLYHSVGSFYAALLLGLAAALFLPYLLIRDRRTGVVLLVSLALLGALAALFAWDTYDLGRLVGGLLTGSETGAGGEAVSVAVGTQPPLPLLGLPERVSPAVFWPGLAGLALLLAGLPKDLPGRLSAATLLLWCALLFAGSRTATSGFPQRFERDLGVPLAVLAALALVAVLRAVSSRTSGNRGPVAVFRTGAAAVAVVFVLALVGFGARSGVEAALSPAPGDTLTPELAAAGEWLREHNTGGKILPSPSYGPIPSRGMLALGGYDGLQAYPERRVEEPRSLPPGGIQEIRDAQTLLSQPGSERARRIVERYDVRYVVLSKSYSETDPRAFEGDRYRKAFENAAVVIYEPTG